jgi:hypothetical protein
MTHAAAAGGRIFHSFLTDWSDDAGPGRTVWTFGGPWPAATDCAALTGHAG